MFMNNPDGFVELLTADLTGQAKNVYQPQRYRIMYADDQGKLINDDEEFGGGVAEANQEEEKKEPVE